MRNLIRHIRLCSVYGLDGRFIDREQFPRLELVTIGAIVKYRGSKYYHRNYTIGIFETQDHMDPGMLPQGQTFAEAKAGMYDDRYVSQALSAAKWFTWRHIGELGQRGFAVHLMLPIFVYKEHSRPEDFDLVLIHLDFVEPDH